MMLKSEKIGAGSRGRLQERATRLSCSCKLPLLLISLLLLRIFCWLSAGHAGPAEDEALPRDDILR